MARVNFVNDIERLLQDHGYDLTLKRISSGGSYNLTTGLYGGGTEETETIRGAWMNYTARDIDGTNIKSDDRKLLIAASGMTFTPQIGDVVNDRVQILNVHTHETQDGVAGYICQTRG